MPSHSSNIVTRALTFIGNQVGGLVIIAIIALALDAALSKSVYFDPAHADAIALAITTVVTVGMIWALARVKRERV